jgi:hypothetical protein
MMGEGKRRAMMGMGPKNLKMDIKLADLKDRICECGCKAFMKIYGLKEMPAMYSPSGQMETVMLHVGFACIVCGKAKAISPDKEFKPEDNKEDSGQEEQKEESLIQIAKS